MKKNKHMQKTKSSKKYIFILILIFIIIIAFAYYKFTNENKKVNSDILNNIEVDETKTTDTVTEKMLQLQELKKENEDIIGWIQIADTKIDFPVLQGKDNEYYMRHTYKKEYSVDGSIFLDKDYDWNKPSDNLLIYGHNNKNGNMFQDLLKYEDENYYKEHPNINFTTTNEDCVYEIIAVFKSRVYYKSEKNVFRYYYFINAENEEEYNYYVTESKKASLYDTGKTAEYGEQLLTLSTCEYSQEDGRFVIVAKKVNTIQ